MRFFDMKNQLYKITEAILYETNNIRSIFNFKLLDMNLKEENIISLWEKARAGIINQYKIISYQINEYSQNDIVNIETTIVKANEEYELKIVNEMKKYDKELEVIDKTYKEIVKIEENNFEDRKISLLNVIFLSFITSSSALLYFLDSTKELKFMFVGIFLVIFTSIYYFYKKD